MTTESNRQIRGRQSGAGSDAAPKFIEEAYLDDGGVRLVIVGMARPRDKEWDVLRTADGSLRYGIPWRWKGQSISVNEVHRYFK